MYHIFLPSEPKKSKDKLSDAIVCTVFLHPYGRDDEYKRVHINVDATVDVLAKALTLFVYHSEKAITFEPSGSSESGLEIKQPMEGKEYHELRAIMSEDEQNAWEQNVWEQIVYLHEQLLEKLLSNKEGDESSVTKILESIRGESEKHSITKEYSVPNKRIKAKLYGGTTYGWSHCEAALFALCVKDAATMDNKFDFWEINGKKPLKLKVLRNGKEIVVWG